jgi:two-component system phosphate regulon sensor histidine kinase PhoR
MQLDENARGFAEMIVRHADRLAQLTADLLDLSRLETGEMRFDPEALQLSPFCASVLELVRPRAALKQIVLDGDVPERLRALCDRRALEQILVNLLDNAIKFTPVGGRVTLLGDGLGPSVMLSVVDTGLGILPQHQTRIFERFYRVDPGRSREAGGTGLGLAIVKHLAQALHGEVGVESSGKGSRFWLKLPSA